MIIRSSSARTMSPKPSAERIVAPVDGLRSPSMPTLVVVDVDSVGACAALKASCASLHSVTYVAVAAHGAPASRAATVVSPSSARSAPLDHVLVTIGLFVGARRPRWFWPSAAPHVLCVTRDLERGANLRALFLYDALTRSHGRATSFAERDGSPMDRGDAATADVLGRRVVAATADVLGRRVAATPRPRRGYSAETTRGDAAAAMLSRPATPRPRRGYSAETSRGDPRPRCRRDRGLQVSPRGVRGGCAGRATRGVRDARCCLPRLLRNRAGQLEDRVRPRRCDGARDRVGLPAAARNCRTRARRRGRRRAVSSRRDADGRRGVSSSLMVSMCVSEYPRVAPP